jgi:hypothetical protein
MIKATQERYIIEQLCNWFIVDSQINAQLMFQKKVYLHTYRNFFVYKYYKYLSLLIAYNLF